MLLIAALLFSLTLAACGSQPSTSAPQQTKASGHSSTPTPTPTSQPSPTPTPAPVQGGSGNLIANGDAESGLGTTDGGTPVTAIPDWAAAGNFDVINYGASGGYPVATDPGPDTRGKNFFGGGPDDEVSTGTQLIDVSQMAAVLDGGNTSYTLSAYLGGYQDQDDNAVLSIQFQDASGKALGQAQIGPVMAADRNNATGLLPRTTQGTVPGGARKILVTLTLTRVSGSANDGYADNLSLTLGGASSGGALANFKTYKSDVFSIQYPGNWQEGVSNGNGRFTTFTNAATPLEKFQVVELGAAQDTTTTLQQMDDSFCGNWGGATGQQHVTTPDISGQLWYREICAQSSSATGLAESVVYQGKLYVITYGGPTAQFASEQQAIFTPMEQSFAFVVNV